MIRLFNSFLILVMILVSSCDKIGCPNHIACTDDYEWISVEIIPSNNISLDYIKTIRKWDRKLIHEGEPYNPESPTIFSDKYISETSKVGKTFIFEGYQDNIKVISEEYIIKHDCCHIIKVSGKDTINL